jgi:predicted ATPase
VLSELAGYGPRILQTLAVRGYRSLRDVVVPLGRLTVITGPNGAGKSAMYRALRLLADCGQGRVIGSLARDGGLASTLWAGPENLDAARKRGVVEGTVRRAPVSLLLGYSSGDDGLGYLIDLGLPIPRRSAFSRDPEIKREMVFTGGSPRPAATLVRRSGPVAEVRDNRGWAILTDRLAPYASALTELADLQRAPELQSVRSELRRWRFYDGFRVDARAPARQPQVGTRTPVLSDDGADLAAALQTIIEAGGSELAHAVADAFDGATLDVRSVDGVFEVWVRQPGMLRGLRAAELSDGTLRFLLWAAALLTVDPPPLIVLNEPETSLHPSLIVPLARMIGVAAERSQVLVVSHNHSLIEALDVHPIDPDASHGEGVPDRLELALRKDLGETVVTGLRNFARPKWDWGKR